MNIGLQQVVQRLEYRSMALNSAHTFEGSCDDLDLEVALSVPGTCVPGMQVALVLDQDILG